MTREAKIMAGIVLITVPSIQYGSYFLLTQLMNKSSGYMDNLRQSFFARGARARRGHRDSVAGVPGAGGRGPCCRGR